MNDGIKVDLQEGKKIFTRREERILRLIRSGTMRKFRISFILVLIAFLIYAFIDFTGKYNVSVAKMQNSYSGKILNLARIKTSTPLEAKLKYAHMQDVKIFAYASRILLFGIVALVFLLFAGISLSLCVALIIIGQRDKLIKKLIDS